MNLREILSKYRIVVIVLLAVVGAWLLRSGQAAGNATYTLSPSSGSYSINTEFTVTVYENSGSEPVNAVDVNLTYDQSKLQFVSLSTSGSPFTTCTNSTGGGGKVNIVCALLGGSVTGNQKVGSVTFKALVGSGSSSVNFDPSSKIVRSTDNSDIWNGDTTGGNYTFTTPAAPPPAQPSPSSSPGPAPASSSTPSTNTPKTANTQTSSPSQNTPSQNTPDPTDPAAPVPVNNTVATDSAYLVAIKVVNHDGKPVENAKVTLGEQTTTSDSTGIASFIKIPAGNHKVTVDAPSGKKTLSINVSSDKPAAEVQQFEVKLTSYKPLFDIIRNLGVGVGVLALVIGVAWLVRQRLLRHIQSSSLPSVVTTQTSTTPVSPPVNSTAESDYLSSTLQQINGSRPKAPGSIVEPDREIK